MFSSYSTISPLEPRPTTLSELPPELILSICDILSPPDLICFSLCNHRIFGLSQKQIAKLPHTHDDKAIISTRLERDLPHYFHCDICGLLHRFDETKRFILRGPGYANSPRQLPCVESAWIMPGVTMGTHIWPNYVFNKFSFLQLKLAMRRVYEGPSCGITTDSLSFTQVCHYYEIPARLSGFLSLFSTEARVCQPLGLYVRMQDIMITGEKSALHCDRKKTEFYQAPPQVYQICQHDRRNFLNRHMSDLISPLVESFEGESRLISYTCEICHTDATIEVAPFGSKVALIVTRWVNLGLGLTQNDIMWRHQVAYSTHNMRWPLDGFDTNPRLSFEDMAPESFEELRSRNLSYLENQRYQTFMLRTSVTNYPPRDLWCIWHKGPPEYKTRPRSRAQVILRDALRRILCLTGEENLESQNEAKAEMEGQRLKLKPE